MTMKRSIRKLDNREVEKLAMANCALMLLSRVDNKSGRSITGRVFKCKTCNRQFQSFQALGGHRASHKRPKFMEGYPLVKKAHLHKRHECSICGLEFDTGQALGGHMRRHRGAALIGDQSGQKGNSVNSSVELVGNSVNSSVELVPVLKKASSSKRVLCWDLNLMPYENGLDLGW